MRPSVCVVISWLGPLAAPSLEETLGLSEYKLSPWTWCFLKGFFPYTKPTTNLDSTVMYISSLAIWNFYHPVLKFANSWPMTAFTLNMLLCVAPEWPFGQCLPWVSLLCTCCPHLLVLPEANATLAALKQGFITNRISCLSAPSVVELDSHWVLSVSSQIRSAGSVEQC